MGLFLNLHVSLVRSSSLKTVFSETPFVEAPEFKNDGSFGISRARRLKLVQYQAPSATVFSLMCIELDEDACFLRALLSFFVQGEDTFSFCAGCCGKHLSSAPFCLSPGEVTIAHIQLTHAMTVQDRSKTIVRSHSSETAV